MANIANDIFENQEWANALGLYDVDRDGNIKANGLIVKSFSTEIVSATEVYIDGVETKPFSQADKQKLDNIHQMRTRMANTASGILTVVANELCKTVDRTTSVTLVASTSTPGMVNEYSFIFTTASNQTSVTVQLDDMEHITWKDGIDLTDLESGATYICSVMGDSTIGYIGNLGKLA